MILLELILFSPVIILGYIYMKIRFWFNYGINIEIKNTLESVSADDFAKYKAQLEMFIAQQKERNK